MMLQSDIQNHYTTVWGVGGQICPFLWGPTHELPFGFSVVKFPPHKDRPMWAYATCCMSLPSDLKSIELHIFSPVESDSIVEILYAVAHFHRTGTALDLGHSVNFGRPWIDQSDCDHGLLSLPYLDGPAIEKYEVSNSFINCYWLIPITRSEVSYKKTNGLEALETLFERSELDYVNPARKTVI